VNVLSAGRRSARGVHGGGATQERLRLSAQERSTGAGEHRILRTQPTVASRTTVMSGNALRTRPPAPRPDDGGGGAGWTRPGEAARAAGEISADGGLKRLAFRDTAKACYSASGPHRRGWARRRKEWNEAGGWAGAYGSAASPARSRGDRGPPLRAGDGGPHHAAHDVGRAINPPRWSARWGAAWCRGWATPSWRS
jgi:hypothetical protein